MNTVEVEASLPYPVCGGSPFLCIVHCAKSEREPDSRLFLDWKDIPNTVLAGAFCENTTVTLKTPLPAPYDRLVLPPLTKKQLRPEEVRDDQGKVLGMMLRVPGLFVQANQILTHMSYGNMSYNYQWTVDNMVQECARLLSAEIKSGILGVRSHPGIMGHALEIRELGHDEIGVSEQFAGAILKKLQGMVPMAFNSIWDLDGFPVYAVRFPVANRFAVQGQQTKMDKDGEAEMYLRILPGAGKYVACNPFNLCKRWLGDRDGDQLFALLRWEAVQSGELSLAKRKRVVVETKIETATSYMSLQLLVPLVNGEGLPSVS